MIGFGKEIRLLRIQKNKTIVQMSKEIGYSKSIIAYWENDKREPTISALKKLCEYFDVSADDLLNLT